MLSTHNFRYRNRGVYKSSHSGGDKRKEKEQAVFKCFCARVLLCSIRLLFTFIKNHSSLSMTKLNKTKIKWLIRQVIRFHKRPEDLAPVYGITARRVRQLVQSFRKTGKMPELSQKRRPETPLTQK